MMMIFDMVIRFDAAAVCYVKPVGFIFHIEASKVSLPMNQN